MPDNSSSQKNKQINRNNHDSGKNELLDKIKYFRGSDKPHSKSDLVAKILCVIAAFCLWIYVMQVESPEYEQTFSHITVDLVNTDELVSERGLAIYSGYGTMIDVTLSGKKSVVSKLSNSDIVATADVSAITESGKRVYCSIMIDVPAGCKLVGMSQEAVSVYSDEASQKTVALSENRENTCLPEDCYTGVVDLPVDMITVTGPLNALDGIDKAVVNLDLTGVTGSVSINGDVILLDKNGEIYNSPYVEYSPREVTVDVPVYKRVAVPIEVKFTNGYFGVDNTEVTIDPVSVEIEGEPSVIDAGSLVAPIEINEKLDFMRSDTDRSLVDYDKTVVLSLADGVKASASEVHVTVKPDSSVKTIELTVPGKNIIDTGAKDGVHYEWDDSPVTVTLCGEFDKITKIEPEDVTLIINMSPYTVTNTGSIKVRAEVEIDSPYSEGVFEIGEYAIWVTFSN